MGKNEEGKIDYTTIQRQGRYQDVDNLNFSIDNQLLKTLNFGNTSHEITVGVDAMQEKVITSITVVQWVI